MNNDYELSTNYKVSPILQKMLKDQMLMEFHSAYLYLSVSHSFAINGLKGFSDWFGEQSKEEFEHGRKILTLFEKLGVKTSLDGIKEVGAIPDSVEEILNMAIEHEQKISSSIHEIYEQARSEGNVAVCGVLKWFIDEQLEEENSVIKLMRRYQYSAKGQQWLLDIDQSL